jgi:hypothetical protein
MTDRRPSDGSPYLDSLTHDEVVYKDGKAPTQRACIVRCATIVGAAR